RIAQAPGVSKVLKGITDGSKPFPIPLDAIIFEICPLGDGSSLRVGISRPAYVSVEFDLNREDPLDIIIPIGFTVGYKFDMGIAPYLTWECRRYDKLVPNVGRPRDVIFPPAK